jgi:hypothetical protein
VAQEHDLAKFCVQRADGGGDDGEDLVAGRGHAACQGARLGAGDRLFVGGDAHQAESGVGLDELLHDGCRAVLAAVVDADDLPGAGIVLGADGLEGGAHAGFFVVHGDNQGQRGQAVPLGASQTQESDHQENQETGVQDRAGEGGQGGKYREVDHASPCDTTIFVR